MKTSFLRELPLLLIVLVPFIYLAVIWNDLPPEIPIHYDIEGNIDRYGSRSELALITFLMPSVIYVILMLLPKVDPKGKIEKMGNKYHQLKFVMVLFLVSLSVYFIFTAYEGGNAPPNGPIGLIGLFLAVMGNYFQSIRPNYFIGIRTPWTLENELVWKETHRMAGKMWLAGGIVIAAISLFVAPKLFMTIFLAIIVVMVVIPIVYSFVKFRAIKKGLRTGD